MTTEEFSNEFDLAVNAYLPGGEMFDEYEKSVFLTKAQEQLVLQLYDSFEKREISREILSPLVRTFVTSDEYEGTELNPTYPSSDCSFFYQLPDDLWLIVMEEAVLSHQDKCLNNKRVTVVPTTHDKLLKVLKNPFKGPNSNRALRLNLSGNIVELIAKYDIKRYFVRYIKKLNPIILTDLDDVVGLQTVSLFGEINGTRGEVFKRTECELHESIHHDILNLAVAMAMQTRRMSAQQPQQQQEQQQPNQ